MAEADAVPAAPTKVQMEVLCLGLCRTGTQSLADALPLLGYSTIYHMREVFKNGHGKNWQAAFDAKFEGIGQLGRGEFDEFLSPYSGVSDIPASIFYEELMDAYPSAKIILTTRDDEKWLASMKLNIWGKYNTPDELSPIAQLMRKYVWGSDPIPVGKNKFHEHNEKVMKAAEQRGREVLVYEVKQGWGPLCGFLGKEVPESTEFPNSDDHRLWGKQQVASAP